MSASVESLQNNNADVKPYDTAIGALVQEYLREQQQGYGDNPSPAATRAEQQIRQTLGSAGLADS